MANPADIDALNLPARSIGSRDSLIRPSSFDPETGRLTYVLTTQDPADKAVEVDGKVVRYKEILLNSGCVNLDRVSETPILDAHRRGSVRDILGGQIRGWIEGDAIVVEGQLSSRAEVKDLWSDVASGILQKMSAGYTILKQRFERIDGVLTAIVESWSLDEGSFVPSPADMRASVRARSDASLIATESPMPTESEKALDAAIAALTTATTALAGLRAKPADCETAEQKAKREKDEADAKAKKEKDEADARAKSGKKDGEDDGGDDGDSDGMRSRSDAERKEIGDLRLILGAKGDATFDAMVRSRFPITALRAQAHSAYGFAAPTLKVEKVTPPAADTGTRAKPAFVSPAQFEAGKKKA